MKNARKDVGKYIGTFTARGSVDTEGTVVKINLFDGRFDTAYRVIEFHCAPTSFDFSTNADVVGKLATVRSTSTAANNFWDWDDSTQIGWSGMRGSVDTVDANAFSVIDPENLIVEDLYFVGRSAGNQPINYIIVMEKFDISESLGAVSMARDRASDSGSNWVA